MRLLDQIQQSSSSVQLAKQMQLAEGMMIKV